MTTPPNPPPDHLPAEDLVAWLDGELLADAAGRVERHVAACSVCAREADLLRRSGALLSQLPGLAPPRGFEERVHAAVRSGDAAPSGRVVRGAFPAWARVAAAVVVVAVGGWWLTSRPSDPGRLSGSDEEAIARDLFVISHLDTLAAADDDELARLADDLDVIDAADDTTAPDDGG